MDKTKKRKKAQTVIFLVIVTLLLIVIFLGLLNSSFKIEKIDDYLYSIECDRYDVSFVNYITNLGIDVAGCSAVRKGSIVGRNLDWTYDDEAEFVVRTPGDDERYKTIGVSSLTGVRPVLIDNKLFLPTYFIVPLFTVDGINEKGLFACTNEAPSGDAGVTTGTNPGQPRLSSAVIVRYVLDYASSVDEAVEMLKERDIYAYTMNGKPYEVQVMLSDRNKNAVIEFIDNEMVVIEDQNIMTNYYLALDELTPYAEGVERYALLSEGYDAITDSDSMKDLMKKAYYSRLYDPDTEPRWYSEMYGVHVNEKGEVFTADSDPADFPYVFEEECDGYDSRTRNGDFWTTTHTSIYDLDALTLSVAPQETGNYHDLEILFKTDVETRDEENRATAKILIPLEVACIIFQLVILYGVVFENSIQDKKSKYFILVVLMTMVATTADLLAWIFDGSEPMVGVQAAANMIALLMNDLLAVPFLFYEREYIRERRKTAPLWPAIGLAAFNTAVAAFMITETIKGNTFYFEGGVYMTGPYYQISVLVAIVNLVVILSTIIHARDVLGKHDAFAFFAYILIPLITTLYELANPILELGFVAVTFSLLLVYILLQAGKTKELEFRERILQELCDNDQLTSLNNRRAYDKAIDSYKYSERSGAIFCDVNGLKVMNDAYGHQAGDALLSKFADILKANFNYDDVFRISGDEFVAFVPDVSEEEFDIVLGQFEKVLDENDNIASYGGAYNVKGLINPVLDLAESRMYEYKDAFYLKHPEKPRR